MPNQGNTSRRSFEDRVRFLSAIARALDERVEVLDIVERAATRDVALSNLGSRFGWDHLEARVVLDLQWSACTRDRRAAVAADLVVAEDLVAAVDRS